MRRQQTYTKPIYISTIYLLQYLKSSTASDRMKIILRGVERMDTSQKLTQQESSAINIMKAVAVLSVISAHVVSFDESSLFAKIASSLYLLFGEIGVIIFFVIGGFLYKRTSGDRKEFWKKKFFRIILP